MAVSILFPDDTIRDVPGHLIPRSNRQDKTVLFVQVPVNCDPMWRYCEVEGHWRAVPRHGGKISILTPNTREWWHSIEQMQDQAADPETTDPANGLRYISRRA